MAKPESMEVDLVKNFEGRGPEMPVAQEAQAANILDLAIQKNMSPEQIDKLWAIQEKIDASIAKKAFVAAMANFKKERIIILKDKGNNQFQGSKYSSIDATVNTTVPYLGKHGFSHGWEYGKEGDNIVVTCVLTHKDGHSKSVTADGEPDLGRKSSNGHYAKNQLQAIKSTRTYLKIETFEAVTGLVSSENNCDDDGNAGGKPVPKITAEQLANLRALCEGYSMPAGTTLQRLAEKVYRLEKIEDLNESFYENAVERINGKAR